MQDRGPELATAPAALRLGGQELGGQERNRISDVSEQKKITEHSKMPLFSRFTPAALDAPFGRLAPPALKSFRHPWITVKLGKGRAHTLS